MDMQRQHLYKRMHSLPFEGYKISNDVAAFLSSLEFLFCLQTEKYVEGICDSLPGNALSSYTDNLYLNLKRRNQLSTIDFNRRNNSWL
jgi:hypothetical protein